MSNVIGGWVCLPSESSQQLSCVVNPTTENVQSVGGQHSGPYLTRTDCEFNCGWYTCNRKSSVNPECVLTDGPVSKTKQKNTLGLDQCLATCSLSNPMRRTRPAQVPVNIRQKDLGVYMQKKSEARHAHRTAVLTEHLNANVRSRCAEQVAGEFISTIMQLVDVHVSDVMVDVDLFIKALWRIKNAKTMPRIFSMMDETYGVPDNAINAAKKEPLQIGAIVAMVSEWSKFIGSLALQELDIPRFIFRSQTPTMTDFNVMDSVWMIAASPTQISRAFGETRRGFFIKHLQMPPTVLGDAAETEWLLEHRSAGLAQEYYEWLVYANPLFARILKEHPDFRLTDLWIFHVE